MATFGRLGTDYEVIPASGQWLVVSKQTGVAQNANWKFLGELPQVSVLNPQSRIDFVPGIISGDYLGVNYSDPTIGLVNRIGIGYTGNVLASIQPIVLFQTYVNITVSFDNVPQCSISMSTMAAFVAIACAISNTPSITINMEALAPAEILISSTNSPSVDISMAALSLTNPFSVGVVNVCDVNLSVIPVGEGLIYISCNNDSNVDIVVVSDSVLFSIIASNVCLVSVPVDIFRDSIDFEVEVNNINLFNMSLVSGNLIRLDDVIHIFS